MAIFPTHDRLNVKDTQRIKLEMSDILILDWRRRMFVERSASIGHLMGECFSICRSRLLIGLKNSTVAIVVELVVVIDRGEACEVVLNAISPTAAFLQTPMLSSSTARHPS